MSVTVTDVGGKLAALAENGKAAMRKHLYDAIDRTAFAVMQRMKANAPVGPVAPHIRDAVDWKRHGLTASVGFLEAGAAAGPGSEATLGDVALFNEYTPNRQPFMRPAAEAEASDFSRRMRDAISGVERDLSGGGGLL